MSGPSDATKRMARIMGCEFTSDKFKLYDHELALKLKRDAAPEMYEALEIYERLADNRSGVSFKQAEMALRSALSKARGEAA